MTSHFVVGLRLSLVAFRHGSKGATANHASEQLRQEVAFRCFSEPAKIRLISWENRALSRHGPQAENDRVGRHCARSSRNIGVLYLAMLLHLYTEHACVCGATP